LHVGESRKNGMLYREIIKFGAGESVIGRGGMGTVLSAVLLPAGNKVAVKSIRHDTDCKSAGDIKPQNSAGAQESLLSYSPEPILHGSSSIGLDISAAGSEMHDGPPRLGGLQ